MPVWRWVALLSFALLAPAALPAGGGERRTPELRRRQRSSEPLMAGSACALRCAPRQQAPLITPVAIGQPLRVLRRWCGSGGQQWIQVQVGVGGRRGWVPVQAASAASMAAVSSAASGSTVLL